MPGRLSQAALHRIETTAQNARDELRILAGEDLGPTDAAWSDVAGTCAVNLHILSRYLEHARAYGDEPGRLAKVCALALGLE